jgi:hypothetical protein
MRAVYGGLPGVQVEPLHFASGDISGERLLSMMKVDENTRMFIFPLGLQHLVIDYWENRNAVIHGGYHEYPPPDERSV